MMKPPNNQVQFNLNVWEEYTGYITDCSIRGNKIIVIFSDKSSLILPNRPILIEQLKHYSNSSISILRTDIPNHEYIIKKEG